MTNLRLVTEFSSLKDSDDNIITLSLSPSTITSLAIGTSATVRVDMDVESSFEVKDFSGNIVVTGTGITDSLKIPTTIDIKYKRLFINSKD